MQIDPAERAAVEKNFQDNLKVYRKRKRMVPLLLIIYHHSHMYYRQRTWWMRSWRDIRRSSSSFMFVLMMDGVRQCVRNRRVHQEEAGVETDEDAKVDLSSFK